MITEKAPKDKGARAKKGAKWGVVLGRTGAKVVVAVVRFGVFGARGKKFNEKLKNGVWCCIKKCADFGGKKLNFESL